VLSHFFWEAGGELQRSFEGCLRTLLWQLLQCPTLGTEACQAVRTSAGGTWTHTRLRSALEAALRHVRTPICLFLDGLDECRDGEDLVEFVEELAGMARLKICVSSRPEQLYLDAFSDKPKLRVQDLNRNDIYTVINEKFTSNPKVGRMAAKNPATLDQLATSIERKAEGVFLWVHLAIKSLLRGFRNRDTLEILQRRLEELPDDIYGLYRNMLQRTGKDNVLYTQQAALYCRLVLHQKSGLRLTDFCLAIDDGLRKQFLQFDQIWDGKITETELDCASAITWLNVRTGGLLEVYPDYPAPLGPGYEHSSALVRCLASYISHEPRFIHRTARDYVLQTAEGRELLAARPISEDQLAQICFECRLISEGVLPAIQGLTIDPYRFMDSVLGCLECQESAQWPSRTQVIQRLCDVLLHRERIQTLDAWIPLSRPWHRDWEFFPSSKYALVDLCQLYLCFGRTELVKRHLCRYGCWGDHDYLSLLLMSLPMGLPSLLPDILDLLDFMDFLVQQGADLNCMILNANQEAICPLVFIIGDLCGRDVIKGFDVSSNALLQRLLTLSANFDAVCAPLCSSCYGIYRYDKLEVELWGNYCVSDMLKLSGIAGFGDPASASSSCVRVIAFSHGNEELGWSAPLLRGISTASSEKLLSTMRDMCKDVGRPKWKIDDPGVIRLVGPYACHPPLQFKEVPMFQHPSALDRLILDITSQSQRLNCFAEALRYMGKTDETIRRWAAHQETENSGKSEAERQRWREWVFGPQAGIQTQTMLGRKRRRSDGSSDGEQEHRSFEMRSVEEIE